jgi:hypothetical protein
MLTDAPPRKANRAQFIESDRITTLDLPGNDALPKIAQRLESAMKSDKIRDVRSDCADFLVILIGYLYGISSKRKLVEELRMHLAWRDSMH